MPYVHVYHDDHTKHQKVKGVHFLMLLPLPLPLPNSVVRSPFFTQVGTDNEAMNRLLVVQRVFFSIYGIRFTVYGYAVYNFRQLAQPWRTSTASATPSY